MSSFEELDTRLQQAPQHILRLILQSMCKNDRSVRDSVAKQLDKFDVIKKRVVAGNNAESNPRTAKRKADEVDISVSVCTKCKNIFSEADNSDTACSYHEGELTWDDEYFVDLYDGDPEPVFEDNPEGFYWTCCEVRGDIEDKGCVVGRHHALNSKRRK